MQGQVHCTLYLLKFIQIIQIIYQYNGMFADVLFVRKTVEYITRNITSHCISTLGSKYSMKNRNSDQCMYISFRELLMSDISIYFTIFSEF